jgi:hypothetical protein
LVAIGALQDGGNEQKFECAAHGESLVRAIARAFAGGRVEDRNTEPAAVNPLQLRESGGQIGETPRGGTEQARQGNQSGGRSAALIPAKRPAASR